MHACVLKLSLQRTRVIHVFVCVVCMYVRRVCMYMSVHACLCMYVCIIRLWCVTCVLKLVRVYAARHSLCVYMCVYLCVHVCVGASVWVHI